MHSISAQNIPVFKKLARWDRGPEGRTPSKLAAPYFLNTLP